MQFIDWLCACMLMCPNVSFFRIQQSNRFKPIFTAFSEMVRKFAAVDNMWNWFKPQNSRLTTHITIEHLMYCWIEETYKEHTHTPPHIWNTKCGQDDIFFGHSFSLMVGAWACALSLVGDTCEILIMNLHFIWYAYTFRKMNTRPTVCLPMSIFHTLLLSADNER